MLRTLLPCCALALFSLTKPTLNLQLPGTGERPLPAAVLQLGERSMTSLMPEDSILYLEAPGLGAVLTGGLEHPFVANLLESELGSSLLGQSETSLAQKLTFVDAIFGEPVLAALDSLSSQGLALSLSLRNEKPAILLAARGSDAKSSHRILKRVAQLLKSQGLDPDPRDFGAAKLWPLKNEAVLVKLDELVLIASDEKLAREALDLARLDAPKGLGANAAFAKTMARAAESSTLRAWVDGEALAAADPNKYEWMDMLQHTPHGQLLLGSGISSLMGAKALGMGLDLSTGDLDLELWGNEQQWPARLGIQHADERFAEPAPLEVEDTLAQAILYRDVETFLAERPALLRPRDLPGVSEALSAIALFFGGMDFGEEISPDLSPWIQLISAELDYTAGPTPLVKYPAVALVAELGHPELSGQRWNTAFQSLIGMINIDAAQKKGGRGSMLLGLSLEGDTVLSHASYPTPTEGDPVDARFNLRPTCGVVNGRLVIGSHEDLVRKIVRSIKAESAGTSTASQSLAESLQLKAEPIGRILQDNFDTLVMNKVVDEGVSFEKATEDTKGLVLAMQSLSGLQIGVDYSDPESVVVKLHLGLKRAQGAQ